MKYILKEKIPFTSYEVGHVFETCKFGSITIYVAEEDENTTAWVTSNVTIKTHEILLMVKAGILEEYDDTFPKIGDYCWFINSTGRIYIEENEGDYKDKYRIKTNNCFRTKEEAEARLKEIMGE